MRCTKRATAAYLCVFVLCQQGNIDFVDDNDQARIKNSTELRYIASLLSCEEGDLDKSLCSRVVAAKGEVVEKRHTIEQAQFGRDAFAKVSEYKLQFDKAPTS